MGDMLRGELMMKTSDGRKVHFENATISEFSVEPEPNVSVELDPGKAVNFTHEFSIKIETITRKRFIKLLMSKGIARNGAKDIASYVRKKYGYYSELHLLFF